MATYRKLASKVKKSKKTGSGANEVYKPEWFAYEKMASFLHSVYSPRKTTTSTEVSFIVSVVSIPLFSAKLESRSHIV